MKYAFFFLFVFAKIAFGCDNDILDVNSAKNISAKVLLKDNDSLEVSVSEAGKQVNQENVDVSSEKKITLHLKITIVMAIKILVFGIWMREWVLIKSIDYFSFLLPTKSSKR
ncbi:hypothetical protein [Pantoea agglomerans]|jgi:hypothetical protein|uniref:hypothetical protein n=1 Tax=Enterobacter agglomerans TaxID=549 RepID=UPI00026D22B6|nr:hypothetical protein [Pantoea agglomerans]MBD8196745.1 hypothetical protein [Pantoea agglomerans]MBD8252010.1 hypothetical protein [Pantoea agglomerans]WAB88804.1 hypothetical protein OSE17_09175 [Pantoea agglomerans]